MAFFINTCALRRSPEHDQTLKPHWTPSLPLDAAPESPPPAPHARRRDPASPHSQFHHQNRHHVWTMDLSRTTSIHSFTTYTFPKRRGQSRRACPRRPPRNLRYTELKKSSGTRHVCTCILVQEHIKPNPKRHCRVSCGGRYLLGRLVCVQTVMNTHHHHHQLYPVKTPKKKKTPC